MSDQSQPTEQTSDRITAHGDVAALTPESLNGLRVTEPHKKAAGMPAVARAAQYAFAHAGVARTSRALAQLNQKGGIDCMSCAWPEPDGDRSFAEFCENGAKALGHEADKRKCGPEFFAQYSVAELSKQSDYWLEQQGRLVHPMVLRAGGSHYQPIDWDDAIKFIAKELNKLSSPDEAVFYTSGRTSNEAAFLYQLFVRQYGTNNLPDCSNMCHESSGTALSAVIGIGKGTVKLDDFAKAQAIFILGQNPGTNHPRMLTTLEVAKKAGAKIVAINPLPEAGLLGFMNPQKPLGMLGKATPLADQFLQIKINGDIACLKGMMKRMLEMEDRQPGAAFDWDFVKRNTDGVEALLEDIRAASWDWIVEDSGLTRGRIEDAADLAIRSQRIIVCWAMGLTQHKNSVQTIQEIVNFLLLRGSIGKPGAGVCPVRGHSNVQGDRTMGIWERPKPAFLDALQNQFDFNPPRHDGYDAVESAKAMHEGKVKVFFQLGGNYLSAMPDTLFLQEALAKLDLTVRVGTKLNRSDLVTGKQALILPCLGRSEIDRRGSGEQFVSCENSMGVVQSSQGRLEPADDSLQSEIATICALARATLVTRSKVKWEEFAENYDLIRDEISRTVPGFENYNQRVRDPGGFYLPNGPRENRYKTDTGRAHFTVNPIPTRDLQPDQLVLMTIRSHDQFNTTIYGMHDRYRGIHNERRVILMNEQDIAARGLAARQTVDITSHYNGQTRLARQFIVVPYPIPKGCCAAYFPEANVLVAIDHTSDKSNQPASKYVVVTVKAAN
ncbi:MAG TPA: FdhF/YdeP family oxidoreductase [Humisphaera sp.]|jgi:molybdopterin-dependent oxidoreductase alpha subunit|nr:FdhF/YdeP family oxidoreductase [Humisphaera sp.]